MPKEIAAQLKFLRFSPRKVRLVVDMIRGKRVERAIEILSLLPKSAALSVLKLLNSAIANARHNYSLALEDLRVAEIKVDNGPALKRWSPRARGRATPIKKRTSHVKLTLVEIVKKKDEKRDTKEKRLS